MRLVHLRWLGLFLLEPVGRPFSYFPSPSGDFYLCYYQRITMNPASSMPGGSSLWQEARNADGRVYYYNVQTKATQWAKPAELLTPVEVSFIHPGIYT
jgi:hypothetical protein